MTVTKSDIVEVIAEKNGFQKIQSAVILETLIALIKRSLVSRDDVLVSRFGRFRVLKKKKRRGRNPSTGEEMMLKPRRVVTFKCSEKLRDRMSGE